MSGLGPAACWLAHKRIETWSRMAKERVGAVRRHTIDRNSEDNASTSTSSTTPPPPMTPPPSASSVTSTTSGIGSGSDSCDLPTDSEEVNISKETNVQPSSSMVLSQPNIELLRGQIDVHSPMHLHHQGRSLPPRMQRTSSISSQSSVDSTPSRHSTHRGSSPQIRTFGPDGRSSLPTETGFPHHLARSPSPMRTISLDARCASPALTEVSELRTASPSQSSLASHAGCSNITNSPKIGRCLSPLLIPPRPQAGMDPGVGPASPLGALQPDLYRIPDGPIYLTAPETSPTLGRLHLKLKYDYSLSDLTVHLVQAQNLARAEQGGFRDPYVRLFLDPGVDDRKRQTQIFRAESNPHFNEHFKFPVSRDQLNGKELIIQVLDYDRYSPNDTIGELKVMVDEMDLSKSVEIWGDLIRIKKPREDRPELLCSLNFLPQAERLTLVILKARNLETKLESFVKVYFILNGKRIKKKKTSVNKYDDPSNPSWNEAFSFRLQSAALHSAAIEIYILGSGGGSTEIGSCGLGPKERGTGSQHWHDMANNVRNPTAMWHYVR